MTVQIPGTRPLVLGHRGARQRAPENTLKAFDLALEEGAQGIEFDVRASGDGVLVVHHDADLEVDGSLKTLAQMTAHEIRAARTGDAEIPWLSEVFDWQDRTGAFLNIEIKADGAMPFDLAERAVQSIRGRDPGKTIISSFHPLIVRTLAEALPELKTALLVEREFRPGFWLPSPLGVTAIHPHHSLITAESMADFRQQGIDWIGVWTVNDEARAIELARLGVDTIISDCPGRILSALNG